MNKNNNLTGRLLASKLTFGHLVPLLKLGSTRPLVMDDLDNVNKDEDDAAFLTKKFYDLWNREQTANASPSLFSTLIRFVGHGRILLAIFIQSVIAITRVCSPLLMKVIIEYVGSPSMYEKWEIALCVVSIFLVSILSAILKGYHDKLMMSAELGQGPQSALRFTKRASCFPKAEGAHRLLDRLSI